MEKIYDVVIVGAGPAGLTAGIYAGRGNLSTLILEKEGIGSMIMSHQIDNYPGFHIGASGKEIYDSMKKQALDFTCEIKSATVLGFDPYDEIKIVKTDAGNFKTKYIIIATGLGKIGTKKVKGENKFLGSGVSYCATCDAAFFSGLPVYVIGGGDSAIEEAIYLTKFAREVTVIHRREGFRANKASLDKARENPNIKWLLNRKVVEIKGDGLVESIVVEDVRDGSREEIHASQEDGTMGIFAFIGLIPQTELFKGLLDMDEQGYIISDDKMQTSVEGVFVAGDCRQKLLRQVVTAVSDGAIATVAAEKYIEETNN